MVWQRRGVRVVGQGLAAFVGVPILISIIAPRTPPVGIFVQGLVIGSLYGLLAVGLVLIYKANKIINFAQAGLGGVPAVLALALIANRGVPYLVAAPLVVVGALGVGAGIGRLMDRFRDSPRLIMAVATIGLAQLLGFFEFWAPRIVTTDWEPATRYETPFSGLEFGVGIVRFRGDHVLAVVVVVVLLVGLGKFLRGTDVGIAIRASAENAERAVLLGISVRRITVVVWGIAAVFSAIGIFLRAGIVGVPVGGESTSFQILLFGLAAAVVARFDRLSWAVGAGLVIGMIDQATIFATRTSALSLGVMLVIMVAVLLARRGGVGARGEGGSSWVFAQQYKRIPAELLRVPRVRNVRFAAWTGLGVLLVVVPFFVSPDFYGFMSVLLIYGLVGVSLVVLTGWAGQVSLGQVGIAGVGGLIAGGLNAFFNVDFFVTLALAGVGGAGVALAIGFPALRIQGMYLAVVTLAFAFTVRHVVLNPTFFGSVIPGGDNPVVDRPMLYERFDLWSSLTFYFVCLGCFVAVVAGVMALRRSQGGRRILASRDNVLGASGAGIQVWRVRLAAFALSGGIAGLAGGLLVYQQGSVSPFMFDASLSVTLFAMVAIGGLTSIPGAIAGVIAFQAGQWFLEPIIPFFSALPGGAGILVVLLMHPGGLAEVVYEARDRYLRKVARAESVYVPSLVADERPDDEVLSGAGRG